HVAIGSDVHRSVALHRDSAAQANIRVLALQFGVLQFHNPALVTDSNRRSVRELKSLRVNLQCRKLNARLKLRGSLQWTLGRSVDFECAVRAMRRVRNKSGKKRADRDLPSVERDVRRITRRELD